MNADIFIGKRSNEILARAKALGFGNVIFVKEVSSLDNIRKDDNFDAIMIVAKSLELLRRMVDKASNHSSKIIVLGTTDTINRAALEHKKVFALASPEHGREYDYMNYRNSGLNQVLCKIAHDNGKRIIFTFNDILKTKGEQRAIVIGRIMQNIALCTKYKTEMRMFSLTSSQENMRQASDLRSLCIVLGMMPKEANKIFLL